MSTHIQCVLDMCHALSSKRKTQEDMEKMDGRLMNDVIEYCEGEILDSKKLEEQ